MELQIPLYTYDLNDPNAFLQNPYKYKPIIQYVYDWYTKRYDPEFQGKLIYRYEKTIPPIIEEILQEMGFTEWDLKTHGEDNWSIFWKNQR